MKPSTRVFVIAMIASCACAIGAACTFPEVGFAPDGVAEGGSEGGMEGSTVDGATDGPPVGDGAVFEGGSNPDADIVKDAGGKVDASGCVVCDCDGDGFNDTMKVGCMDAGGAYDCDDNDTRTKPGQGFLDLPAEAPQNGNWNCVNGVEKYFAVNVSCAAVGYQAACDSTQGFTDDPPCGVTGHQYVKCKRVGDPPLNITGSCAVDTMNITTKQACK